MLSFIRNLLGGSNDTQLKKLEPTVKAIEALEAEYKKLTDEQLQAKTAEFKRRLAGGETEDDILLVHGHAVAVRRAGRLTKVQGNYLYDEFGDLSFSRLLIDEDDDSGVESSDSGSTRAGNGTFLYRLTGDETSGTKIPRSVVSQTTKKQTLTEPLLLGGQGQFDMYAYVLMDRNGVTWDVGDAYGFEFASIDLPNGYIFGSTYSRSLANPVAGEGALRFKVSANGGSGASQGLDGASSVAIYCLRPGSSGNIDAQSIGSTDNPASRLQN